MKIKIESGVPLPQNKWYPTGDVATLRRAIGALQPGQSFVWDRAYQSAYRAAQQVGAKIRTSKDGSGGVRIWRLA